MRVQAIVRLLQWRWAPCMGLLLGTLAYILLVLALIPDHFPGVFSARAGSSKSNAVERDPSSGVEAASGGRSPGENTSPNADGARARAESRRTGGDTAVHSLMAPTMELPPPLAEQEPPPAPELPAAPTIMTPPPEPQPPSAEAPSAPAP